MRDHPISKDRSSSNVHSLTLIHFYGMLRARMALTSSEGCSLSIKELSNASLLCNARNATNNTPFCLSLDRLQDS